MLDTLLAYLPEWLQNLSTHIDYEGQRKSERIFQVILVVHGVLGFIAGYMVQQLSVTIYTVGIGFAISCLVVLPPWPFYRRNPLNWQPNPQKDVDNGQKGSSSSGNNKSTKKSR
uniref:Signal peptidase complex subunit 1 n=3 Tax=Meloidogyne TaxID=189290 RepID=A0A914KN88_MELIC